MASKPKATTKPKSSPSKPKAQKALTTTIAYDGDFTLHIPAKLTQELALDMWNQLGTLEKVVVGSRFRFITEVVERLGHEFAVEMVNQGEHSPAYGVSMVSIAEATKTIREAFPAYAFNLPQLRELAVAAREPAKQMRIAKSTVAHDLSPIAIRAAVNDTSEEAILISRDIGSVRRSLERLHDNPDAMDEVMRVIGDYIKPSQLSNPQYQSTSADLLRYIAQNGGGKYKPQIEATLKMIGQSVDRK